MRLRNNIFAAAFDYLKREKGIKTQKRLAELMEVSEDTITRILKDRTEVTEDMITRLQTASGCIFNLQWLRGEDPNCMLAEDIDYYKQHPEKRMVFDDQHMINTQIPTTSDLSILIEKSVEKATAYADKYIATLEKQVADKDEQIADLRSRVRELEMFLNSQSFSKAIEKSPFPVGVADDGSVHILVDKG